MMRIGGLDRESRLVRRPAPIVLASQAITCLLFPLGSVALAGYDPAGLKLPPGFKATTYITGSGFHGNDRGIPAVVSMAFHADGTLYLARTANRLREMYGSDAASIYRFAPGPGHMTPATERGFLFGPPIDDPDEVGVNASGEVFVSSKSAARGSVYRLGSSMKSLFAGDQARLRDPEGIAFDKAGHVYVVDQDLGVVVQLDATGQVLDPRWVAGIGRGRTLTFDSRGDLWIGSDGPHDAPHSDGSGRILRFRPASRILELVHAGPLPSGMSFSPGGNLFVAQRRSHKLFALTADGIRVEFASFTGRSALRTLAFAPVTEATKKLGIAGDLFVMVFPRLDYPVREIIRITGPFDAYVREAAKSRAGSR